MIKEKKSKKKPREKGSGMIQKAHASKKGTEAEKE